MKNLVKIFADLKIDFSDPPKPPKWITDSPKFFGSYLAGLIDSDGNIGIKRKKYPQCRIRITSDHHQDELKLAIEKILNCKASIEDKGRFVEEWGGGWYPGYDLIFLVSKKNWKILKENTVPFIAIPRKRTVVEKYLQKFEN